MKKYNYELTDYPEIYKHTWCYWGGFINGNSPVTQEIIDNRNDFIKEFRIRKFHSTHTISNLISNLKTLSHNKPTDLDHIETYVTHQKAIIVVISNYGPPVVKSDGHIDSFRSAPAISDICKKIGFK